MFNGCHEMASNGCHDFCFTSLFFSIPFFNKVVLKDKYPNFEMGLKCIIMVFKY